MLWIVYCVILSRVFDVDFLLHVRYTLYSEQFSENMLLNQTDITAIPRFLTILYTHSESTL